MSKLSTVVTVHVDGYGFISGHGASYKYKKSKKRIQIETYIYILFLLSVFALRPATSYDSHPSVIASTAVIKGI